MHVPDYEVKPGPEFGWLLVQAAIAAAAGYLLTTGVPGEDWKPWLGGLIGVVSRPVLGLILDVYGSRDD